MVHGVVVDLLRSSICSLSNDMHTLRRVISRIYYTLWVVKRWQYICGNNCAKS